MSQALPEGDHGFLLNLASFRLQALGRLTEALEPMRASKEMGERRQNWRNAGIGASNLSELELLLGKVSEAVRNAEQSVIHADRDGDAFHRLGKRTTFATALHQLGRFTEAEKQFREAELIQADDQPQYPMLYSLQGFRFCDLLLNDSEYRAWKFILERCDLAAVVPDQFVSEPRVYAAQSGEGMLVDEAAILTDLRNVSQRAAHIIEWNAGLSLLSVALGYLALGRAELYEAILSGSSLSRISEMVTLRTTLDEAASTLRRAGTQDHLPRSLLTRAWFRFLTRGYTNSDSAQEDLDEAWEIAERGPMRLHMADIHLYRARLFFREEKYPWESAESDLEAAEKLINECEYHRRDEELADAKRAILGN